MDNSDIIIFDQNMVKSVGNAIALTEKLLALKKDKIKILIANDHILFYTGVKKVIEKSSNMIVVGHALSFQEVYTKLKETSPDILLTDDQMPQTDFFFDIPNVNRLYPDLKIIVHTLGATESHLSKYIQHINGYIEFTASEDQYHEIFEKVYSGSNYFVKSEWRNGKFIRCLTTDDKGKFVEIIENIRSKYSKNE